MIRRRFLRALAFPAALAACVVAARGGEAAEGRSRAGTPPDEAVLRASEARVKAVAGKIEGGGWNLWSDGALADWFDLDAAGRVTVTVRAAGQPAARVFPRARLRADDAAGEELFSREFQVPSRDYGDFRFEFDAPRGTMRIELEFLNDLFKGGEDRNLLVREIRVSGARPAAKAPTPPGAREKTAAAIREQRTGELTVVTRPGAAVRVTQLRHEFQFGTAIAWRMFREDASGAQARDCERYLEILKTNFNAAVHENALKWYHTERKARGEYNWRDADRMVDWCLKNGITIRGHCIFWPVDKYVQQWIKDLDDAELRRTIERRASQVTARYRGRIGEYDLSNEMLHGRYYRKRLGDGIVAEMARWAKTGDPEAVLYVNDYGILGGGGLGKYVQQIRGFLDRGIPVGGIGCQGHFGGSIDCRKVKRVLDTLAQFKLPIKITEFDMNTSNEEKKAETLDAFYRTCFAHPAVEGILMWGFWEGRHWRPKAALWKKDWTPTPAAEAYRSLVYDEWWTRWEGEADAEGRCRLRAFYGAHLVEGGGREERVELRKRDGSAVVEVGR